MYEKKYLPLTIDCESTMEVSRVDMDMLGDSLLLWCEITCWNTKFGLIDWRGIQNMTSGIFYRKTTWIYILRKAITKRFLQGKRIDYSLSTTKNLHHHHQALAEHRLFLHRRPSCSAHFPFVDSAPTPDQVLRHSGRKRAHRRWETEGTRESSDSSDWRGW